MMTISEWTRNMITEADDTAELIAIGIAAVADDKRQMGEAVAEASSLFRDPDDNPFGVPITLDILRSNLSSGAISSKPQAPEDYLFMDASGAGIFSTIDFAQLTGGTGTGKTLFAMGKAASVACGADFLVWPCAKPRKVIYFDGELAETTIAKRLHLAKQHLTPAQQELVDENLLIFNRDTVFNELQANLEPLDSVKGRHQVEFLVDLWKADMAIFDSRFCLLAAEMKEENSMPKGLILSLRQRRCFQLWVHHTGKDSSRGGYGDKTAEFLMDTNIMLTELEDGRHISLEFKKRRKHDDDNGHLYADMVIKYDGEWLKQGDAPKKSKKAGRIVEYQHGVLSAVRNLASTRDINGKGHAGEPVARVSRESIRQWLNNHGHLEMPEGKISSTDKNAINKAIRYLIQDGTLAGDKESLWVIQ